MEFGMFFTQEAFPGQGEMLMPIPNTKVCWLPELTPKMLWHFQLLLPPHGIEKPTGKIDPKNTQITRIQNIWEETGGADVPAPLGGI